jgi:hypothetical protein
MVLPLSSHDLSRQGGDTLAREASAGLTDAYTHQLAPSQNRARR